MENIFLQVQNPTLFTYFSNSNFAGQMIVLALIVFSLAAWTIMIGKYLDLKRVDTLNKNFEKKFRSAGSVDDVPVSANYAGSFQLLFKRAYNILVQDSNNFREGSIKKIENAIDRALSDEIVGYESKLVFLSSIVSGAPFLGLLGTVWGVMDSFGAMALQSSATLQSLAPGVSGALLTTVAALLVAIPSVFGYNYLLSKVKSMVIDLENFSGLLVDKIESELEAEKVTANY